MIYEKLALEGLAAKATAIYYDYVWSICFSFNFLYEKLVERRLAIKHS